MFARSQLFKQVITPARFVAYNNRRALFYSTQQTVTTPETQQQKTEKETDPNLLESDKAVLRFVGGLPEDQAKRKVIIHQPARNAMQQGLDRHSKWRMEWMRDTQYGARWADPMMGWTASTDPLNTCYLHFDSKDAAVAFATKYGYEFVVENTPVEKTRPPKSYAANFKYHKVEEDQW